MRVNNMSENRLLTEDEVCKFVCIEPKCDSFEVETCEFLPMYKEVCDKAFAAGEQAQGRVDAVIISNQRRQIEHLQEESAARGEVIRRLTDACSGQKCKYVAEARKEGARKFIYELRAWAGNYCQNEEHRISKCQMKQHQHCHDCFNEYIESKLKELE